MRRKIFILALGLLLSACSSKPVATLAAVSPSETYTPIRILTPTSVATPTPTPTATQLIATPKPTSCNEVEGVCLELTFTGESCHFEGPTNMKAGPVTLIYFNKSDSLAFTNMIWLSGNKTYQDVIEYSGEEPFTTHHPDWSVEIPGVWRGVVPAGSRIWTGHLTPGIYALVCFSNGGGRLGGGFYVEK